MILDSRRNWNDGWGSGGRCSANRVGNILVAKADAVCCFMKMAHWNAPIRCNGGFQTAKKRIVMAVSKLPETWCFYKKTAFLSFNSIFVVSGIMKGDNSKGSFMST